MIKDSFIYLISKIIPGLAGFAMVILFMRQVGAVEYGKYALVLSCTMMCSSLSVAWINQSQLRYCSGAHDDHNSQFTTTIRLSLIIALVVVGVIAVIFILLTKFIKSEISVSTVCAALAVLFSSMIYNVKLVGFQSTMRPQKVVKMEMIRSLSAISLPLLLVLRYKDHRFLLVGISTAYIVTLFFNRNNGINFLDEIDFREWINVKKFWGYGWPMSLWAATLLCFPFMERFLIQHFIGFEKVGFYASVYDIVVRAYSLLFFPITLAMHPRFMVIWNEHDNRKAMKMIKLSLLIQISLLIPLVCGVLFFSPFISRLLALPENVPIKSLMIPLSLGGALWQMALIMHKPLEALKRTKLMLIFVFISLAISVTVNSILLPHFGLIASAYAYLLSALFYISCCLVFNLTFSKHQRQQKIPDTYA